MNLKRFLSRTTEIAAAKNPFPAPAGRGRRRRLRIEQLECRRVLASISDLGTLGGAQSAAYGINNLGQIVGYSYNATGHEDAFLYSAGKMTDLGTLPGFTGSVAVDINDSGDIVGSATSIGDTRAFLYSGSTMHDLGVLSFDSGSNAYGINNSGTVVGTSYYGQPGEGTPFVYNALGMQKLNVNGWGGVAAAINDSAEIVGNTYTYSTQYRATLWTNGVPTDLGSLYDPYGYSSATSINNAGQIVGNSSTGDGDAFFYDGHSMTDLGTLPGYIASFATSINNYGQAVGFSTSYLTDVGHAVLYADGQVVDLNTLLPSNSGWTLERAQAINDHGQIVGFGLHNGVQHAFLLDMTSGTLSKITLTELAKQLTQQGVLDTSSIVLRYTVSNAPIDQPLTFNIYQSDQPSVYPGALDSSTTLLGQDTIAPSVDSTDLSEGEHTLPLSLMSAFTFDPARPYLVVVANPDQSVNEDSSSHNTVSTSILYTPAQIRTAYGINNITLSSLPTGKNPDGSEQTIAIIDAYDDQTIQNDLDTFDAHFNLPKPLLAVVNEFGQSVSTNPSDPNYVPPAAGNYSAEEAMDVEWAHAIAPGANIILVESRSILRSDLTTAIASADNFANGTILMPSPIPVPDNVSVVSMSFGYPEGTGIGQYSPTDETSFNQTFATPKVTYIASTGDNGTPGLFPAYSPAVIAVGGTSLQSLDALGDYPGTGSGGEIGWSGSGGGVSQEQAQPPYQVAVVPTSLSTYQGHQNRTIPDVAFDADSTSGVFVYDSKNGGWLNGGGSSLGAPCWSALIAIADQGRVASGESALSSYGQTLPAIYGLAVSNPSDFSDIQHGSNGSSPNSNATTGYDLVTGWGTPVANNLVPDLVNYVALAAQGTVTLPTPVLQNMATGKILLGTFTQGALTQAATSYSATVAWGDNTSDNTAETNSPINIVVSGQTIQVFGSHSFSESGALVVGVSISGPDAASATSYTTARVAADVSSQVSASRSGLIYNRGTRQFYGSMILTNTGTTSISGSLDVLLQGLTSGVSLTYASVTIGSTTYSLAITKDSAGDPYIEIPQGVLSSLAAGQSLSISLRFSDPTFALIGFTPKVFSDPFSS